MKVFLEARIVACSLGLVINSDKFFLKISIQKVLEKDQPFTHSFLLIKKNEDQRKLQETIEQNKPLIANSILINPIGESSD